MWRTPLPLTDVLRMLDLIKEIHIKKYEQEEYRLIVDQISRYFIANDTQGDE
jgi:hypothetical protein